MYSVDDLRIDVDMIVREDDVSPAIFVVGDLPDLRAACKRIGIYAIDYSKDIDYEYVMAVVVENISNFKDSTSHTILEYTNNYDTIDAAIHAYYLRKQV